jgi:hypothetical protein
MDTDMAATVTAPKSSPADIARIAADGIATGVSDGRPGCRTAPASTAFWRPERAGDPSGTPANR